MRFPICLLIILSFCPLTLGQEPDSAEPSRQLREPLQAVYVYAFRNQRDAANRISRLLEPRRIKTTIVHAVDLDPSLFVESDLVIIGFGTLRVWGTKLAVDEIRKANLPILALGEGGHKLLEALDVTLGKMSSERGKGAAVGPLTDAIFWDGFRPEPVDGLHQLFKDANKVSLHLTEETKDVIPIAEDPKQRGHYLIAAQKPYYLYLGFESSPEQLTDVGQNLLPWACYYAVAMKRHPQRAFATTDEAKAIGVKRNDQ